MTVIMQGGLQYQNTFDMKGAVSKVEREEIQQVAQNPDPFHKKVSLEFDHSGHLVKAVNEDSLGTATDTNVWENGKVIREDVCHHRNDGKFADWDEWQQWSFDKDGRVSEFKAGKDKEELNDYVDFKYDDKVRALGYELYAQTLNEVSYSKNKITLSRFQKYQHRKFFEQVQLVDEKGRVTDLKVSDLSGSQLKLWYHVAFKYDDKGRVIEQQTEPFNLGSGDDYSPIPGKLVVEYNDTTQSGEQKFYDVDGKLLLHTRFGYDRDGVFTKLRVFDAEGKEHTGGEIFIDAQHKSSTRPGQVEWEIIYDDRDNWTERRRWFTPADGGPKVMTRLIRQTITYR